MYKPYLCLLCALCALLGVDASARAAVPTVNIVSQPPGATIYIDGKDRGPRGVATDSLKLHLAPGAHDVLLELPGYRPLQATIVVARDSERFPFALQAAMERLVIRGDAGDVALGAQIFIDGVATGTVPASVEVHPGRHRVEVRRPGQPARGEVVVVAPGEERVVTIAADQPALASGETEEAPAAQADEALRREVALLHAQVDRLLRLTEKPQAPALTAGPAAPHAVTVPAEMTASAAMPGSAMPGAVAPSPSFWDHFALNGTVLLRYDWTHVDSPTDVLQDSGALWNALRTRARLGVIFDNAIVIGGLRITAGQSPNPTVSIVSLGDAFRPKAIGFDQLFFTVRPFKDRDRLSLSVGKMPNTIWRGDRGTIRDELIWDDDISPEGLSLHVTIFKTRGAAPLKLENTLAYFQLNNLQDFRFVGLTGTTYMIAEQLRLSFAPYLSAAVAYYDIGNLNAGAYSPSHMNGSADGTSGTSAFLLRPGLQATNNLVSCGGLPGNPVLCFQYDHYRIGNLLLQLALPLRRLAALGAPEIFLLGNYTRNFAVPSTQNGYGITLGLSAGAWEKSKLHPVNLWATWRQVDADATLATIADSDLGAGTGYRGVEVGANYRISRNLLAMVSYFDFMGAAPPTPLAPFPSDANLMENHVQRLFVDLLMDF